MVLQDFFLRKTDADLSAAFLENHSSFDYSTVEKYIADIIAIPFDQYLEFIKTDPISPCVLSSDVPQFSNIEAATKKICEVLHDNLGKGYKFEQIGELLQPEKKNDIVANKKYGENHVKTAAELALCLNAGGRYYLSPIGALFGQLSDYQRDQLLSRLVLRNAFVYCTLHKVLNGSSIDIVDEISFLSESTVKRRKNNCLIFCRLIQRNRDLPTDHILSKIK